MIKFFRKIRQRLLTENKFSKYLLYAVGEILLVIIGILIALNINNRNLVNQNEATFDALFSEIQKDLILDFKEADRILAFDAIKDSTINLVLNNKVTKENYKEIYGFTSLITSYEPMRFSDNGYTNLRAMIDKVPKKYKEVVDQLNTLHLDAKLNVIRPNEILDGLVLENLKKWANTKLWFSNKQLDNSEKINYLLTDPFYKNDLTLFQMYLRDYHITSITMYKHLTAKAYISISKILEPKKEIPKLISSYIFDISDNVLEDYVGDYKDDDSGRILKFVLVQGELYLQNENIEAERILLIPKTKTTFTVLSLPLKLTFEKNKNGNISGVLFKSERTERTFPKLD